MSDYSDGAIIWKTEKPIVELQLPWGHYMQSHPDLYNAELTELKAEICTLEYMTARGNEYAKRRLEIVKTVHDELEALSASKRVRSKLGHEAAHPGDINVTITNPVQLQAPVQSQMSTAAALGLGAGAAALLFLAFSGVAVLAIFGLFAALLILAILGMAYLLHRDSRELPHYAELKAPLYDTLQPLAVVPEPQALPAETRRIEHKPVRAITTQKAVEATPLVRKSSAVSIVHRTSKDVKVS